MKAKNLNESFNILFNEEIKFEDFDVEKLYNTIYPETKGSITYDEMDKVYKFLDIDKNTDIEKIRGLRNTIVKYASDKADELRPEQEKLSAEFHSKYPDKSYRDFMEQNPYDIMWDQMSAFTGALDHLLFLKGDR